MERSRRLHRLDENTRRREARRNSGLRGNDHPAMSAKCRADILTKIGTHIWVDDGAKSFGNSGINVAAHLGMNSRANISGNAWTNFQAANFRTNWNGGERIAAKNI